MRITRQQVRDNPRLRRQLDLAQERQKAHGRACRKVGCLMGCEGPDLLDVVNVDDHRQHEYNFRGNEAALRFKKEKGFVYIHIEAPDECGHRYEIENKVKAIELIDELVIRTLLDDLAAYDDFSLMVLPDHPTPLSLRTHTADPVPYIIYRKSSHKPSGIQGYDEFEAQRTGIFIEQGHKLMDRFFQK